MLNGNRGLGPLDGYFLGVSKGSLLPVHTSNEVRKCKRGLFCFDASIFSLCNWRYYLPEGKVLAVELPSAATILEVWRRPLRGIRHPNTPTLQLKTGLLTTRTLLLPLGGVDQCSQQFVSKAFVVVPQAVRVRSFLSGALCQTPGSELKSLL